MKQKKRNYRKYALIVIALLAVPSAYTMFTSLKAQLSYPIMVRVIASVEYDGNYVQRPGKGFAFGVRLLTSEAKFYTAEEGRTDDQGVWMTDTMIEPGTVLQVIHYIGDQAFIYFGTTNTHGDPSGGPPCRGQGSLTEFCLAVDEDVWIIYLYPQLSQSEYQLASETKL